MQEVIKEIAQSHPLQASSSSKSSFKGARSPSRAAPRPPRDLLTRSLSRARDPRSRAARRSRPALTPGAGGAAPHDGEVHGVVPPHPVLQQPEQGDRPAARRCLGARARALARRDRRRAAGRRAQGEPRAPARARRAHRASPDRNLRRATLMLQASHESASTRSARTSRSSCPIGRRTSRRELARSRRSRRRSGCSARARSCTSC